MTGFCAERGEVCFEDEDCCEPYHCDNRSMYCDKANSTPSPGPTPPVAGDDVEETYGGDSYSFSYWYDDWSDDDFWDSWMPAPSPITDAATLAPIDEPDVPVEFDEEEEPERPEAGDKPESDDDCLSRLSPSMLVSRLCCPQRVSP